MFAGSSGGGFLFGSVAGSAAKLMAETEQRRNEARSFFILNYARICLANVILSNGGRKRAARQAAGQAFDLESV